MKTHPVSLSFIVSFICLAVIALVRADDGQLPPADTRAGITFDKDIKPIFEKNCIKCHGEEKQKGNLRLDSLDASIKGGKHKEDVVPGKSEESLIVKAVAHLQKGLSMPPKGTALTSEEIALLRGWIDQGAK
jgi:mono/diheme cytochrome c family protein